MATLVAPTRSLEQRREALKVANRVRTARAQWKAKLKAGDATVLDLMGDPLCDTMRIYDVLVALPKMGRVKANRTLLQLRLSPSKPLSSLSYRQRRELLEALAR